MNEIEKKVLERVVPVLHALKLDFVIVDSDGNKHGSLDTSKRTKTGKKVRTCPYPRGVLRDYIRPYIDRMPVNTTMVIPAKDFGVTYLAAAASTYAGGRWGPGTYTIRQLEDKSGISVTHLDKTVTQFLKNHNNPLVDLLGDL